MRKYLVPILCIILFIIPFFWLSSGQMDIGGDTSRLYFYDPLHYLQIQPLYSILPSGIGGESISYWGIPYFLLLTAIKSIVKSPTIMINIFHGINLSLAFLFVYLIIKELRLHFESKKNKYLELVAVASGLFYIFSPTIIKGWDKEILTHSQIFLNPLMFFLLFRFITRNDKRYLFASLIITFIFSYNFSFVGAPDFFSFYPLIIVFIILYTKLILRRKIPIKSMLLGTVLFALLQLFHLGPQISSLFTPGGAVNTSLFSSQAKFGRGLSYFIGVAPSVKVSFSFLNLAQLFPLEWISYTFIVFPLVLLLGFLFNKGRQYLLTALFFFIMFFFVTANITFIGFTFYSSLFNFPGFSMFRNYFGQWSFVFIFFYSLLFGQALQIIFQKIKNRYVIIIFCLIVSILLYDALPFINTGLLNKYLYQSKNVSIISEIDPEYEQVLSYIRNLPVDGKFISLPLTDPGYQMISGKNGGAYQGPSTISYLAGKDDFTGDDDLTPFNTIFLTLVKNNDISGINRLFSILNITYVFYNSDSKIYDSTFPKFPYTNVKSVLPQDQKGYNAFLAKLPIHKIKDFGPNYHIYEVNRYLPHFYTADNLIYASDALTPFSILNLNNSLRSIVFAQEGIPKERSDVILSATDTNPLADIFDNYHLHIHDPYISRKMDDIFYPLVSWNEKRTLKKLAASPNDYIDYSLFYLAKRVSELAVYNETPIMYKHFQEPKLWQIYKWMDYYSWEGNLSRLDTQANVLIDWVKSAPISDNQRVTDTIKINESLSGLEYRLRLLVSGSNHSDEDNIYLQNEINNIFSELYQKINLQTITTGTIPYRLEMPQELTGQYIPYLHSEKGTPLDPSRYSIQIHDSTTTPVSKKSISSTIAFSPIEIAKPQTAITLFYKPQNLLDSTKWVGVGNLMETPTQTVFTIDDNLSKGGGFSKKITSYRPERQYLITFDYYTQGNNVLFGLYEKQKQNNQFLTFTYFNKILSSKKWRTQQSVVTSSQYATNGYIQFVTIDDKYTGKLHIKNLSVIEVPNDTLLFRKVNGGSQKQSLPTIRFKKINKTRYVIHVTNAVNPYTLVFSEAFSNNWKLYLPSQQLSQSRVIASYFGGQVQEEKSDNTFFNFSFLNNGKLVNADFHIIGNDYANAWYVKPENVGNKKEYDLEVVYQPQVTFYYYLSISVVTFFGLLICALIVFIRKK